MSIKEHNDPQSIKLKPIIGYPREAQVGKSYLMSIDIELAASETPWSYPEEEYAISFILETRPFFSYEPLGRHEPSIVLHRFGGTYGPAEYLLTAARTEVPKGTIGVTFVNGWGIPIAHIELECEVKREMKLDPPRELTITRKSRPPASRTSPYEMEREPLPTHASAEPVTREIIDKFETASHKHKHSVKDEQILHELAKAIRSQRCVLLIGLGLALPADVDKGQPQGNLKELLGRIVKWCENKKLIEQKDIKADFEKMIADGKLEMAERKIEEYLISADQVRQCISEVLLQSQAEVQYLYRLLAQIPFRAYFTTGFDEFLETEYKDLEKFPPLLRYYKDSIEDAIVAYQMREPFILKLHGDVTEDYKVTLNNLFAKDHLREAIVYYPKQLRELLADVHTLFVGFEEDDPDLEGLKSVVNKEDDLNRWSLMPESHLSEDDARILWRDGKITTLYYTDRAELVQFLRKLEELAATPQEIEVYVSYAPEDNEMRNRLQKHLSVMHYPGLEITWSDGEIEPGQERKRIIEEQLKRAQVILLLVSVDYLSSINESNIKTEMTRAVQRHRRGEALVIPIIVRSCAWRHASIGRLAALPSNETPIDLASNIDQVFLEVAKEIKIAIEEWVGKD